MNEEDDDRAREDVGMSVVRRRPRAAAPEVAPEAAAAQAPPARLGPARTPTPHFGMHRTPQVRSAGPSMAQPDLPAENAAAAPALDLRALAAAHEARAQAGLDSTGVGRWVATAGTALVLVLASAWALVPVWRDAQQGAQTVAVEGVLAAEHARLVGQDKLIERLALGDAPAVRAAVEAAQVRVAQALAPLGLAVEPASLRARALEDGRAVGLSLDFTNAAGDIATVTAGGGRPLDRPPATFAEALVARGTEVAAIYALTIAVVCAVWGAAWLRRRRAS